MYPPLLDAAVYLVFGVDTATLIQLIHDGSAGEAARAFLAAFGIYI